MHLEDENLMLKIISSNDNFSESTLKCLKWFKKLIHILCYIIILIILVTLPISKDWFFCLFQFNTVKLVLSIIRHIYILFGQWSIAHSNPAFKHLAFFCFHYVILHSFTSPMECSLGKSSGSKVLQGLSEDAQHRE